MAPCLEHEFSRLLCQQWPAARRLFVLEAFKRLEDSYQLFIRNHHYHHFHDQHENHQGGQDGRTGTSGAGNSSKLDDRSWMQVATMMSMMMMVIIVEDLKINSFSWHCLGGSWNLGQCHKKVLLRSWIWINANIFSGISQWCGLQACSAWQWLAPILSSLQRWTS